MEEKKKSKNTEVRTIGDKCRGGQHQDRKEEGQAGS
jgi:hypothetical protein